VLFAVFYPFFAVFGLIFRAFKSFLKKDAKIFDNVVGSGVSLFQQQQEAVVFFHS